MARHLATAASALATVVVVAALAWPARISKPYSLAPSPGAKGATATTPAGAEPVPAAADERPGLSKADRTFIWETENVAFQIVYKAGPALSAAIASGDRTAVAGFFADAFAGVLPDPKRAETVRRPFAVFEYQKVEKTTGLSLSRDGFVDWLLAAARRFHAPPQVQLAVIDLAPDDRQKLDGPWSGVWLLRWCGEQANRPRGGRNLNNLPKGSRPEMFSAPYEVGAGAPLEITTKGRVRLGRLPKDYARDRGWIESWDMLAVTTASADRLLMEDVTAQTGIDTRGLYDNWSAGDRPFIVSPGGVYAGDPNGDGKIDLLITDQGMPHLYINQGNGSFVDRAGEMGLRLERSFAGIALFADLDNDGDEDLVLGRWIYENRNGFFMQRRALPAVRMATGYVAGDFDRDGLVDIYVVYAAPPPHEGAARRVSWLDDQSGPGNQLFRNLGDFRFADVTKEANASAGHRSCFTAAWLDANDDLWPDLYVINELGNNVLLVNQKDGSFREQHVGPRFDGFAMGLAVGDLANAGRIDLYLGNMKSKVGQRVVANLPPGAYSDDIIEHMKKWVGGNLLLANVGGLKFEERSCGVDGGGWSYGPAVIDFDGDGRLDLFSTCGFASKSRWEPDG